MEQPKRVVAQGTADARSGRVSPSAVRHGAAIARMICLVPAVALLAFLAAKGLAAAAAAFLLALCSSLFGSFSGIRRGMDTALRWCSRTVTSYVMVRSLHGDAPLSVSVQEAEQMRDRLDDVLQERVSPAVGLVQRTATATVDGRCWTVDLHISVLATIWMGEREKPVSAAIWHDDRLYAMRSDVPKYVVRALNDELLKAATARPG